MKSEAEMALETEALKLTRNLVRLTWSTKPQRLPKLTLYVSRQRIDWLIVGLLAVIGALAIPYNEKVPWTNTLIWCVAGWAALIWIITFIQAVYWTRRMLRFLATLPLDPVD